MMNILSQCPLARNPFEVISCRRLSQTLCQSMFAGMGLKGRGESVFYGLIYITECLMPETRNQTFAYTNRELWIAREKLAVNKSDAAKIMHGTKVPCRTWSDYCEAIGSQKRVINRLLRRWFKTEKRDEGETLLFPN